MVIKYNTLNRVEPPMLTLCNPGCEKQDFVPRLTRAIGVLQDCEAVELVLNFNSPSELNFRINQVSHDEIEDITERHHVESLYEAVQNRRVIFAEMVGKNLAENPRDEVGFFQITNVEAGYADGHHYKDVTAQSIEVEFQQWTIPYIEDGTYYFCEPALRQDDIPSILDMIVDRVPLWTIDHVDSSLRGTTGQPVQRTFEDVDVSTDCLSFMLENLQETFDCIILFDPIHRTVNAYDKANYVKQTNIHITTDDVISGAKVTDNAGDLCTALTVRSSDDVGISAVNPLGGNTIYDFSYYKPWMSAELAAQVTQWEYDVEHANFSGTPFMGLVNTYYEDAGLVRGYEMELDRLTNLKTQYERCRDNIVASKDATLAESNSAITSYGGTAVTMRETIAETVTEINQLIAGVQTQIDAITIPDPSDPRWPGPYEIAKAEMDQMDAEIRDIQDRLTPEHYFRPDISTYIPQFDEGRPSFDANMATLLEAGEAYEWSFDGIGTAASWRLTAAFFSTDDSHTLITSGINGFYPRATYNSARLEFVTAVTSSKSLVFTPSMDCYVMLGYYGGGTAGQGEDAMRRSRLCKRTNGTFDELVHYIYQGDYVDEYTVITEQMDSEQRLDQILVMLDRGKGELSKVSTPSEEFDVDVESVLFSEKFENWDAQLETGCLINVDLEDSPNLIASVPTYTNSNVLFDVYKATRLLGGERYILSFDGIEGATSWAPTAAFFTLGGVRIISLSGFSFSPGALYDGLLGVFYVETATQRRSWMFTAPQDCYVIFGFKDGDTSAASVMKEPLLRKAEGNLAPLFLSTITANYDDYSLNLTFGNKYNKFDPKSLFDKVLGNVTKTATDLSFVKSAITNIRYGQYDAMREAIEDSRNVTMRGALAAQNQQFVLDESGFTGRTYDPTTGTYSPRQIKITAENIVFTTDAWGASEVRENSAVTAIGHLTWDDEDVYGVNAQVLIGNLIIGQKLVLKNDDASPTLIFDQNGLDIHNSSNEIKFFPGSSELLTITDTINDKYLVRLLPNGSLWIDGENINLSANDAVTSKVGTDELGSLIEQEPDSVRIAWNHVSQYVQFYSESSDVGIRINTTYTHNGVSQDAKQIQMDKDGLSIFSSGDYGATTDLLMRLDRTGNHYYYKDTSAATNYHVGKIGTEHLGAGEQYRGLSFLLDNSGSYMSWSYLRNTTDTNYSLMLAYYARDIVNSSSQVVGTKGFHFFDTVWLTSGVNTIAYSDGSGLAARDSARLYLYTEDPSAGGVTILGKDVVGGYPLTVAVTTEDSGGNITRHNLIRLKRDSAVGYHLKFYNNGFTIASSIDMDGGYILNANVQAPSDIRLKTNVQSSEVDALSVINGIDIRSFDWIESGEHEDAGIVAQELREIVPSAVAEDDETTLLSINQTKLIPYIIKAIQELSDNVIGKKRGAKTGAILDKWTESQKRDFIASIREADDANRDTVEEVAVPAPIPDLIPQYDMSDHETNEGEKE